MSIGNNFALWFSSTTMPNQFVQSSTSVDTLQCKLDLFLTWWCSLGYEVHPGDLSIIDKSTERVVFRAKFSPGHRIVWKKQP
jgi:hypothetical protein